jgi:integrase
MMPGTTAPADEPGRSEPKRRNATRLRQGVMKRGNTWSYVIRVKDPATGVSKPRWVGGFSTEDAAKAARDEARVKARQGQYIDHNSITVATYLDQWIDAHAIQVKPKTLQDYRHLIDRHIRPRIGDVRLQAVRPATITKLYRDLATSGGRNSAGLSPRTVEYVHAVLRKAFRDAVVVDQLLPSNPVERAKRPRKTLSEPGRVWIPGQLRAFLDAASQHRLFAFYRLAAYTGARRGELLNLRWRDIDIDLGEVRITGSAAVIAGQRIEGTTKSGRSRTVSIDAETVQVLRDHRKRQAEERLRVGPKWRGTDDYVFTTGWGEPIHPDTVSSLMTVLINVHNDPGDGEKPNDPLPHARLHDMRHVHATTLLLAGVPVHVVAARLGHADPSITLRVYAHVISDQLTEAADIFARAIADTG